ncbi:hypothetical protein OG304_07165 [Streptomyces sp. NBC_00160]|uniref:hypothetical protein n=1 Tax=Streptomyces sp. NBC_00160 TaxID=2903628 RepID=UPI00225444C8|nr:hypothetical protein [Streptomyces sp. NBC_00160]MCX5303231.1 hypothetical protein [Streptomyces sp. NBC_00160]
MITVQSFDHYGEWARFEPATGSLVIHGRHQPAPQGEPTPSGHYGRLGDVLAVFYRYEEDLRLRIGDQEIELGSSPEAQHERLEDRCRLTIGRTSVDYTAPAVLIDPSEDPTPFAEPEDFDFGLFVVSVLRSPSRRTALYLSEHS